MTAVMLHELRMAIRQLIRRPAIPLIASGVLCAMSVAVAASMAFYLSLCVQNPSFDRDGRIGILQMQEKGTQEVQPLSMREFEALADQKEFTGRIALAKLYRSIFVGNGTQTERMLGSNLSSGVFRILRVQPLLGRVFVPGDDLRGSSPAVLLSYRIWRRDFQEDPNVVGRPLLVDGVMATVVGVMRDDFRFPNDQDIWVSLGQSPAMTQTDPVTFEAIVDLRGNSPITTGQHLESLMTQLRRTVDPERADLVPMVMSFRDYYLSSRARMSGRLILLLALGFAIVGAINVLNLFTTWVLDRRTETALLQAIGIPRASLARLVVLRYGAIFLAGIAASILPIWAIFRFLTPRLETLGFPYWLEFRCTPQLIGWMLAVGATTFGLTVLPSILISIREDLSTSAVAVQRASIRTGWTVILTFAQTFLMATLGYVSISLLQSSANLAHADLGFAPQKVLTVRFGLRAADFSSAGQRQQIVTEILRRCASIPGVGNVSVVSEAPGAGDRASAVVAVNSAGLSTMGTHFLVHDFVTSDAIFRTLNIPILAGEGLRDLAADHGPARVVISRSLAKRLWPDRECVGASLTIKEDPRLPARTVTVSGVIPDICAGNLYDSNRLAVFSSFTDRDQLFFYILVGGRESTDVADVRREVRAVSPKIPIYLIKTYEQYIGESAVVSRMTTLAVTAFSLIAFVVGGAGIYSFAIYRVIRRRRDFAIRLAIGGEPNAVWFRYARSYIMVSLAAASAGIVIGIGIDRLLPDLLYGVSAMNFPSTGWTAAAIGFCVMAALGPAFLRIRRIVPAEALKA